MKLNHLQPSWPKIALSIISASYFFYHAFLPEQWAFFDGVDLIIHEAGHTIFMFFGNFFHVLGGTIIQLLAPLSFVIYFVSTRQQFSSALTSFWLGQSLINVSVYAKDAIVQQLPLLGGASTTHDWNFIFSSLGLLPHSIFIAKIIYGTGFSILAIAFILSIYFSFTKKATTIGYA